MKNDEAEFLFLGTGGSMGVPVIGCNCSVCLSTNPFNKRFRSSGLIRFKQTNILIDCGPDFRMQALRIQNEEGKIGAVNGLILTHGHYDHIGGLDDLRALFLFQDTPISCFLSKETENEIKRRFDYIFEKKNKKFQLMPSIELERFEDDKGVKDFLGLKIRYFSYSQQNMRVTGIRCGNLAYISDIKNYQNEIFDELNGIETLIISALRFTPSPMHLTVDEAIQFSKQVNPKRTFFTHIAHELDHEKTNGYLPTNIQMGYDGLKLNFQIE